jgi:hypothetical protein
VATLEGYGSTGCTIGDKTYYDFSFTNFKSNSNFGFENSVPDRHLFNAQTLELGPTDPIATYSYKMKINTPPGTNFFYAYQTGSTIVAIAPGSVSATKTLTSTGTPATVTSVDGAASAFGMYPLDPGPVSFSGIIAPGANTTVSQFTDTVFQQVPGPLPVLGAGAAFGFSRKLRKRIKQAG